LEKMGYSPLPIHLEPSESPRNSPELAKQYPLILVTGSRTLWFLHSQLRNLDKLRSREPEPTVELNPATAKKFQVSDGQWVVVETLRGSIKAKAKITEDIIPEVVNIPHGWRESNVNILTNDKPETHVVGYPALKSYLCRIHTSNTQ